MCVLTCVLQGGTILFCYILLGIYVNYCEGVECTGRW